MKMGRDGKLSAKFPDGKSRLINGHEGVVWVPAEKRFAIVLIRGGDSYDHTRYTEDKRTLSTAVTVRTVFSAIKTILIPICFCICPKNMSALIGCLCRLPKGFRLPIRMPVPFSSLSVWRTLAKLTTSV